jgi:long-chain acyl-CoA synthetase
MLEKPEGQMLEMAAESLIEFVRRYAAKGGEVAVRQRCGYRMESWTYAKIGEQANRAARELEAQGLGKGDAALLWGENSAEWIVTFLGCLLRGVVVVPLDHASTAEFVTRVAREVNAKLLLHGRAQPEIVGVPALSFDSLTETISRHDSSAYPSPQLSRQDTLEIIFTSGTTAEPRGVVISHGNVLANTERLEKEIQKYLRYEKFFHPIRFLNLLPLSHVFGQMLGVFIPPMLAGTVVFMDSLKPMDLLDTIRRERVSVLVAVPRFIESLQREVERHEEREGRLKKFRKDFALGKKEHFLRRWLRFRRVHSRLGWKFWAFISGGAALPEQAETFWQRLGYAVIQGYGMTETASLISLNHPFHLAHGSIGKVFPGMEVRVDDNGEILVRGEGVAKAYRTQGASQPVAEADGWFRTGDIAEKDPAGNLYFRGRKKNVIVTPAGMNVYPEDLERALRSQTGVRDCVVIGLERDGNAEPYAVLLMKQDGVSAASVVEHANQSLAEYQRIRQWLVWPEPDFPRTATQKPILPRIRELVNRSSVHGPASTANRAQQNGESLARLITQITGRQVDLRSKDANLEKDLQLSSLDRVELMSVLEERYQVELNEANFQESATIGQLEKLIAQGTGSATEYVYPTWPQNLFVTIFRLAVYYLLAWPATYIMAAPKIRGRQNLRDICGPVLVIANHVTYLDIAWVLPALPARLRHRLATAMRGERLAEMRRPAKTQSLFERFMERLRYFLALSLFNVFPLPRQSGFLQSFSFAGNLVDRGWNILVFPEGRTSDDGKMAHFQAGIGLLAKQLNLPVVPMFLDGLSDLKQDERLITRPGHVRVAIGAPVRFSPDRDPNEITQELERRVRELQSV